MTTTLLFTILINFGVQHPEIVTSQAIIETGWELHAPKNNLFGLSANGSVMTFTNVVDSIRYYRTWQQKYYKGGDYYDFLNCIYVGSKGDCKRYASDPNYTTKLQQVLWLWWSC
jgi:hypothetical protein